MRSTSSAINDFLEVAGIDSPEIASFFLKRNHNRLTASINDYFSNPRLVEQATQSLEQRKNSKSIASSPKLKGIFDKYKEAEPDPTGKYYIGVDGTLQYLKDLEYEPEDTIVLCLANFLESESVGDFREEPFMRKWSAVGCDTLEKMRKFMDSTLKPKLVSDPKYFTEIYQYTFRFILDKGEKKLPLDFAAEYWRLLIPKQYFTELDKFTHFMHVSHKMKVSRDQWNMLLPFLEAYHEDPELKNYDESQSWPLLMDEFYEFIKGEQ